MDDCTDPPEGAETGQNTATNPCAVLALRWCKDLDAHVFDCQALNLVQQTVTEALGQRRTS